jgi:CRP-like cAMP-binding protein
MNSPTEKNVEAERTSGFQQDLEHLRQVPLFQNLDYECLKLMTMLCKKVEYIEGDLLMDQGEDDGTAYLLIAGKLESYHKREQVRYHVQSYEPGQFIGGIALLGKAIRFFTVEATEKSTVLRINRTGFQKVMQKFPDSMSKIAANLAEALSGWEQNQLNLANHRTLEEKEQLLGISLL